jgi:uncharacterized protein (DUF427 family)
VDILQTSRHVKVSVGGEVVAESSNPVVIYETGLPPRWYFKPDEVREQLLEPSDGQSTCAYKGVASYWTVGDEDDVAWYYPRPTRDAERVKDRIAFFNERVDIEVDGELQERPETQWSRH